MSKDTSYEAERETPVLFWCNYGDYLLVTRQLERDIRIMTRAAAADNSAVRVGLYLKVEANCCKVYGYEHHFHIKANAMAPLNTVVSVFVSELEAMFKLGDKFTGLEARIALSACDLPGTVTFIAVDASGKLCVRHDNPRAEQEFIARNCATANINKLVDVIEHSIELFETTLRYVNVEFIKYTSATNFIAGA